MQSFNTVSQKVHAHMKENNITYPDDVKFFAMASVIWKKLCIVEFVYRWNGVMVKCRNGDMVKWWNGKIMIYINNVKVK